MKNSWASRGTSTTKMLRRGRIVGPDETFDHMISRVVDELTCVDRDFGTPDREALSVAAKFRDALDRHDIVLSTSLLTNAGRHAGKALSGCVAVPVSLHDDLDLLRRTVDAYHEHGMGAGYCLDDSSDPVRVLRYLNQAAVAGAASGRQERPVGNIAILSDRHPGLRAFVVAKVGADSRGEEWRFNLSVNVSEAFMTAALTDSRWTLADGSSEDASALFEVICESAHGCGDPGLVFMERFERDNPLPRAGRYLTVGPCAESGLVPGEACHFGYVNVGNFVTRAGAGLDGVDVDRLARVVHTLVRMLDNAVEVSLRNYPTNLTRGVVAERRKVGVGVCGLADLLVGMGIAYGSEEACRTVRELLTWVNFQSKRASYALAETRGSFPALSSAACVYTDPGYLPRRYGHLETALVEASDWEMLGTQVASTGKLRHSSTVAFPPTGRSAPIIRASTGVEPYFLLRDDNGIMPAVLEFLRRMGYDTREIRSAILATGRLHASGLASEPVRHVLRTAVEIPPDEHLRMAATIGECGDESVSKTVNLPASATVGDVRHVFTSAFAMGMKGVTVYRDGCRQEQPMPL
jgi:ribonucleoside-diphosphate reductase alpha chain